MKTLLLILALCVGVQSQSLDEQISTFRNSKRFEVNYDRFKDQTKVSAGPFAVATRLLMSAQFEFDGSRQSKPSDFILLIFESRSRDWVFLNNKAGYAIIDGERLSLGEGVRGGRINTGLTRYSRVSVTERLVYIFPIGKFRALVNAKNAELRVGPYELQLKDEHLTAFRDLLSLMRD